MLFYRVLPRLTEFYQDLLSEMVVRCFEMVSGWRGSCPAVLPSFFLPGFGWRSFEWRLSLSAAFVGCAFGARRSAWDVVQDGAEGRRSQRKRNEKRNKITIHAAAIFTPFNVPLWLGLAAREEARDCTEFFLLVTVFFLWKRNARTEMQRAQLFPSVSHRLTFLCCCMCCRHWLLPCCLPDPVLLVFLWVFIESYWLFPTFT